MNLTAHTVLSVPEAVAALNAHPAVEFAEPNYIVTRSAASNGPKFTDGSLWGMYGDASAPANPFGSVRRPFRTICQAHLAADDGDTLRIRANSYREDCILSKRIRLEETCCRWTQLAAGKGPNES